ncbi:hypothetical protein [Plantactinospora soyae]|uniref:Asp23/Gls24 family envelope stress response protein n=1 Tax=Plantactinospora soyae TaxID=1544732 RepID=A0A927MBK7_9ACTN|nr:hypothetical protein [Plantactinospora soyae]MBE1490595.1 hypothetical protein [Plantactinospora soyae]
MSGRAGPGTTARGDRAETTGPGATATTSDATRSSGPTAATATASPTSGNATEQAQRADPATVAAEIRTAVLAVPGVTRLTPGTGVEVATHFPGGKITGIRLGEPIEVHVEIGPVPIAPVAEQIRDAVRDVLGRFGRRSPVEVVVDDIDLPVPATATVGN